MSYAIYSDGNEMSKTNDQVNMEIDLKSASYLRPLSQDMLSYTTSIGFRFGFGLFVF